MEQLEIVGRVEREIPDDAEVEPAAVEELDLALGEDVEHELGGERLDRAGGLDRERLRDAAGDGRGLAVEVPQELDAGDRDSSSI
jgi:hypothetical protein